ncbi:MAG: 30S ribosomal protein S20 [Gammaproteobacteria bacterium]
MANTAQSKKRARQNVKRRAHNVALRSRFRTFVKKVVSAIKAGNVEEARTAFQRAVPVIDGMVSKGIIHKNKAARHKSRLSAQIKTLSTSTQA